jgi:hypothetical protein
MCHLPIFADPLPNVLHSSVGPNNDQTRKKQPSMFAYLMTKSRMNDPHSCILESETMTINIYNDICINVIGDIHFANNIHCQKNLC